MNTLKQIIKTKAAEQTFYKSQRKTVNLIGERKLDPHTASYKHLSNREDLRDLYIAYAICRGKDPKLAIASFKPDHAVKGTRIGNLVDKYETEFKEAIRTGEQ